MAHYLSPMDKPIVLAIDTAGPRLQLALLADGAVDCIVDDIATGHAEIIFDKISALLKRHNLTYADLTRLAVTTGPGSFTGLRIGLSAARGLALGLNLPVIGVPTLLAMSLSIPQKTKFTIVRDARRGEAYVQSFKAPGQPETAATLMPLEQAEALDPAQIVRPEAVEIGTLAQFAASADPSGFSPDPFYIRDADAKPQLKGKIAHAKAVVS